MTISPAQMDPMTIPEALDMVKDIVERAGLGTNAVGVGVRVEISLARAGDVQRLTQFASYSVSDPALSGIVAGFSDRAQGYSVLAENTVLSTSLLPVRVIR